MKSLFVTWKEILSDRYDGCSIVWSLVTGGSRCTVYMCRAMVWSCDSADFTGDLKDREWGNLIAPGGIWKAHYTVEAV